MASTFQTIHLNGEEFQIPNPRAVDWGQRVTDFLVAIPSSVLQPNSGLFTLTEELNFGDQFGVRSLYFGSNASAFIADDGLIRLAHDETVSWRNFALDGNLDLGVNASDELTFNGVPIPIFSVGNTDSIDMSLISQVLSADVNLSGSTLAIDGSGVKVSDGGITNTQVNASAGIVYSKLDLTNSIVNADINTAAAITRSKIASGTAYRLLANDSGGVMSENAALTATKAIISDSNGQLTASTTTPTELAGLHSLTINRPVITDGSGILTTEAQLAISRGGTNSGTALNNNRIMQSSGGAIVEATAITAARALVSDSNGIPVASVTTTTELSYVSGVTSSIQTQLNTKALDSTVVHNTGDETVAGVKTFTSAPIISPFTTPGLVKNLSSGLLYSQASLSVTDMFSGAANQVLTASNTPASATGTMNTPRYVSTATLLANDKVLIVGGLTTGNSQTTSCELYTTSTGVWATTGSTAAGVYLNGLALLSSGNVLTVGGNPTGSTITSTCYLYNTLAGTWSTTGALSTARYLHGTIVLSTGLVLAAGGTGSVGGNGLTSCERYTVGAATWASAGTLNTARKSTSVVTLANGKILAVGGITTNPTLITSCELYDPTANTWAATGSLNTARSLSSLVLLPNNKVLAIAGDAGGTSCEIYDPNTQLWSAVANFPIALASPSLNCNAILRANGLVTVLASTGTSGYNRTYTYNYQTDSWTRDIDLLDERQGARAVLLSTGNILVAGGVSGGGTVKATCDLYVPAFNVFKTLLGTTNNVTVTEANGTITLSTPLTSQNAITFPTSTGSLNDSLVTDGAGTLSFSARANTALSNLGTTTINASLFPSINNNIDLGADAAEYREAWIYSIKHNDASTPTLAIATTGNNGPITITAHGSGTITLANSTVFSSTTVSTVPYLDASKILVSSAVTPTELGYVSGVTSAIQTQLNAKKTTATGNAYKFETTDVSGNLQETTVTASRAVATDANGLPTASATTATELGYVNGVTSAIQTQLNGKQATLTIGDLTDAGTDGITIGSGTGAVIGSGTTISQHVADASHNGYLSSTDWSTFNSKVSTSRSISTNAPLAGGGDLSTDRTLSITQSTTSTDGYLSSTDWNTFNNKVPTGAITSSGLTQATARLLGRTTASTGAIEEISVGAGLTLSAGSLVNSGVTSLIATSNQTTVSGATGAVTIGTAQDIAAASSPTFAGLTLSSALTVANGGTGLATITAHDVLIGAGTSAIVPISPSTAGFILTSNGTSADPSFQTPVNVVNSGTAGRLSLYATSTTAVSDTYVQNSQNITLAIATQASRSAALAMTFLNPANAVTATNVVQSIPSVALTAQNASIGAATLITTPALGMYRVNVYAVTTTAGSAGTLQFTLTYTDNAQAQTINSSNVDLTSLSSVLSASYVIQCTSGTTIQYATTLANGAGSPAYSIYIATERLT